MQKKIKKMTPAVAGDVNLCARDELNNILTFLKTAFAKNRIFRPRVELLMLENRIYLSV